ncbi:MAG: 3-dehydroquinate synthase [Myxococcales bacterium]|nr:3-dehydroquinate synthase [Myxococcales bacterium]
MMRVFLSGPMGSGKTTAAQAVAASLGLSAFELDSEVERDAGKSVRDIFESEGEAGFRQRERRVMQQLLSRHEKGVFSLGGGTVTDDALRAELLSAGLLVTLDANDAELARRIGADDARPLLAGQDAEAALGALRVRRASAYAECHGRVDTTGSSPEQVAEEVAEVVARRPILLPLGLRSYRVEVGCGIRSRLAEAVQAGSAGPATIVVSDDRVGPHWASEARRMLQAAGREVVYVELPSGEEHKRLSTVERIWNHALDARVDRGAMVVGIGGGVVGDLSGFAASTLLRGVPVGHLPSTLLAMVDSAIGGKTGFDTDHGKNLVGSFHQPSFVICDVELLQTLPSAELISGLAEVAKSAWLAGEGAVCALEQDASALVRGEPDAIERAVRMAAGLKARIVSQDEREGGKRALLNLGHTVGHAIEASRGFRGIRHGEAVSLGMIAACRIAERLGAGSARSAARMQQLLQAFGLPTDVDQWLNSSVVDFLGSDKKRRADRIRFVVPGEPGDTRLQDISMAQLEAALQP